MGRKKQVSDVLEAPAASVEMAGDQIELVDTVEVSEQPAIAGAEASDEIETTTEEETDPREVRLAVDTLFGDVRDAILERLRLEQDKRPWTERSESEQRLTVNRIEVMARNLVREACMIIAGEGQTTISAKIEQVTVKDEIKAVVSVSRHNESRHALVDAQGCQVLMVVVTSEKHMGERAPVVISADQGDLIKSAEVVHSAGDGAAEDETAAEQPQDDGSSGEEEVGSDLEIGGLPDLGRLNGASEHVETASA